MQEKLDKQQYEHGTHAFGDHIILEDNVPIVSLLVLIYKYSRKKSRLSSNSSFKIWYVDLLPAL